MLVVVLLRQRQLPVFFRFIFWLNCVMEAVGGRGVNRFSHDLLTFSTVAVLRYIGNAVGVLIYAGQSCLKCLFECCI